MWECYSLSVTVVVPLTPWAHRFSNGKENKMLQNPDQH